MCKFCVSVLVTQNIVLHVVTLITKDETTNLRNKEIFDKEVSLRPKGFQVNLLHFKNHYIDIEYENHESRGNLCIDHFQNGPDDRSTA